MRKSRSKDCDAGLTKRDDSDGATMQSPSVGAEELAPRAPVTALRWFGRGDPPLRLPAGQQVFTIGAGECDLVMPCAVSTQVAARHATVTREGTGLRVVDRDSAHGTFRALRGSRAYS